MVDVLLATAADMPALGSLIQMYMKETFERDWGGSVAALERDALGRECEVMIARRNGENVGFAAWRPSYDLHHCVSGGEVIDLFVRRDLRGHGVGLRLIAAVAARIRDRGRLYVSGQAPERGKVRQFYERIAMSFAGANCIVGGRAFRVLADLSLKSVRGLVRG